MQATKGCANQTTANACVGNQHDHPDQAAACANQVSGLTCGQIRDQTSNLDAAAPACGKICVVDQARGRRAETRSGALAAPRVGAMGWTRG